MSFLGDLLGKLPLKNRVLLRATPMLRRGSTSLRFRDFAAKPDALVGFSDSGDNQNQGTPHYIWCTCAPLWVGVLGDSYRNRHWFSTERGHAGVGFSVYRCVIPHCIWCAWVLLWASLFGSFCRNQHCFLIKTAHAGFGFSVYFSAILHAPASSDPPLARAANSRVGKAQGL